MVPSRGDLWEKGKVADKEPSWVEQELHCLQLIKM